ncbi:uncharacterized protein [Mytilus edulis]|uniref:uncharacterized protein n=1 Tax=Mytilus edulis TaxID=6550 RepID=UPI0039EF9CA8
MLDFPHHSNQMTLEMCTQACHTYRYLGLQNHHQGFCGNTLGDSNRYQKKNEDDCSQQCRGNLSQICGGTWRNSVYEFITATVPTTDMTTTGHSTMQTTEMTTPEQYTVQITEMTTPEVTSVEPLACLCPCSTNRNGKWDFLRGMNLTLDQLREVMKPELDLMKKELSVNKSNTTRMRRSKMTAPDDRVSATSVGYVGVVFICLITVLIVFIDIIGCFVAKFKRRF